MSKRALLIFTAIMLFTGLVALQVASISKPRATPVVTLPDGSTLRLESVSYGKEHYLPGAWWQPLARHLPLAWQAKLPMQTGPGMSTSEPSLGVWLSWAKTPSSGYGWWDFGLVDEHGVEAPVRYQSSHEASRTGQPTLVGRAFTAFPRRGAEMTLRVYQQNTKHQRELAASFPLNNPARGTYPEWRPQPLPATVKHGDLEITFKQLLVGVDYRPMPATPRPGVGSDARLEFDLKVNGVPTEVWMADGVELTDATRNKVRQNGWSSGTQKGEAYMRWQPYLWASETVWKVRTEFKRNERGAFTTNELIEVRGLAVPPPDGVTELNLSTNRLGHTVRVFGHARGKGQFGSRHSHMGGAGVTLEVDVSPSLGTDKRLTVLQVRDDQGRTVQSIGHGSSGGSFSFGFDPKADVQSLDFTLAVQEVVTAEFLVKPVLFKPPTPAK